MAAQVLFSLTPSSNLFLLPTIWVVKKQLLVRNSRRHTFYSTDFLTKQSRGKSWWCKKKTDLTQLSCSSYAVLHDYYFFFFGWRFAYVSCIQIVHFKPKGYDLLQIALARAWWIDRKQVKNKVRREVAKAEWHGDYGYGFQQKTYDEFFFFF